MNGSENMDVVVIGAGCAYPKPCRCVMDASRRVSAAGTVIVLPGRVIQALNHLPSNGGNHPRLRRFSRKTASHFVAGTESTGVSWRGTWSAGGDALSAPR